MQSRERMLKALKGEPVDRVPVLCVDQTATYEQMEELGVYWPEANYNPGQMAGLAAGAYTVLGFDAVRVPFCQTVESEALGCVIKDGGRENVPGIRVHPYKAEDRPEFPEDFLQRGRLPRLIEALKILKEMVGDRALVIGGVIGPFSIAGNLLGVTDLLRTSIKKPHLLEPFLEVGEKAAALLGRELAAAGADAICIEDMMCSMDMISPDAYRRIAWPWQKRLVENLGDIPTIIHICGKTDAIIEDMANLGATAISVEEKTSAPEAIKKLARYDRHIALIGGVNAPNTLYSGNIDKIIAEVRKAVADGYHMIAPGCSIPPGASTDGLRAMVRAVC
ncbi:MAG: MtaA/CmuA family methyltransferase [Bacillota bacterium]